MRIQPRHLLITPLCTLASISCMSTNAAAAPRVLASTPILQNIIEQINCSSKPFTVETLVPRDIDAHSFVMTPQGMKALKEQSVIIVVGGGYEPWFQSKRVAKNAKVLELVKALDLSADPHFWHSPTLTFRAAQSISTFLKSSANFDAGSIQTCLERYRIEIDSAKRELQQKIEKIPEKRRSIATNHDALGYFGTEYRIRIHSLLGLSSEERPTPEALRKLTEELRSGGLNAIFLESGTSAREIESVARSAKISIGGTLTVDNLTTGVPASNVFEMWRHNMTTIVEALEKSSAGKKTGKDQ